jgi:2-polyprenyl-3-methyl-5-hydroxy-6-metoxy-1,4-benzoquinol methylase
MKNTLMHETLINHYNKTSFTHNYIFGFEFKGNVYAVATTNEVLPFVTTVESAGKGCGLALKYKPNTSIKMMLMNKGAKVICSTEYFNEIVAGCKYNRGEVFERLITEMNGQRWAKDNVPYTEDGDITVNDIAYQIKFEKATFINESQMIKMRG